VPRTSGVADVEPAVRRTVVSLHAHPDDEALLCAGTLARLAAEGHRVVLVVATLGEAGLTDDAHRADLGARRRRELEASARALGVARTVVLGHPDSGMHGEAGGARAFCRLPVDEVAGPLAALLQEEDADVLTTYDPAGGYGHPDHRAVHAVGVRAAALAGTPVVLQATVDRDALVRVLRVVGRLPGASRDLDPRRFATAFLPRAALTHRVDVRGHVEAKRAAMRAHVSQATGGADLRTLALLLRLPRPVFRLALGREWYAEVGRAPGGPLLDDVLAGLRAA
jgi:LmbE family N-acetylglucosaminyl deacetylase